jgi:hypothetical protein
MAFVNTEHHPGSEYLTKRNLADVLMVMTIRETMGMTTTSPYYFQVPYLKAANQQRNDALCPVTMKQYTSGNQ